MSKRTEDDPSANPNVPGFLTKTFEIFSNPKFEDICSWGPEGDTIIVKKIDEFSKTVLPKFFKHSNFQSFVRQLNMYDFHKTVQDPSHGEFQHMHFLRGRPDLLHLIKRKAHGRSNTSDTRKRAIDNPQVDELRTESSAIINELIQLRKKKDEIENRLSDMEHKQLQLQDENATLKATMEQSLQKQEMMRQRMHKILYFMYEMYTNAVNGRGGSRRLDGPGGLNAINLGENYAEALQLLDLDGPNPRFTELNHPAIEDVATSSTATPRFTEVGPATYDNSLHNSNDMIRLASFDSGAALVEPPSIPFGRVLSIEAPPAVSNAEYPSYSTTTATTPPSSVDCATSNSMNNQSMNGSSLQRMYSVIPDEGSHLSKRPRTRVQPAETKGDAVDSLQADLSSWNENQTNLMTRIDSLDATLSQLLDGEGFGSDPPLSSDDTNSSVGQA